jgi:signal transduction histidine kinase
MELAQRDDELRALGKSVNRMADMLARYEEQVRRTERMRALAHLGGGIAHQLRNTATGCLLALDLHAAECGDSGAETIGVAKRQLCLMEQYLRRFLQLGKTPSGGLASTAQLEVIDLAALVTELLPLVEPTARHAGVELRWQSDVRLPIVRGDVQQLSQVVINLLTNAVEAAAEERAKGGAPARVEVRLAARAPKTLALIVGDTGSGPAAHIRPRLFEPFVTAKPDGVGLGLSVAREIAEQHQGRIHWSRQAGLTEFVVELPGVSIAEVIEPPLAAAVYS